MRARSTNLDVQPERDAPAAADGVDISVEADPSGGEWLGHVSIEGDLALARDVRGERCEDVVAALAVITVLRFEGRAREGAAEATARGSATPAAAGADVGALAGEAASAGSSATPPQTGSPTPIPGVPAAAPSNPALPGAARPAPAPLEPVAPPPATVPAETPPPPFDSAPPLEPDVGTPAGSSAREREEREREERAREERQNREREERAREERAREERAREERQKREREQVEQREREARERDELDRKAREAEREAQSEGASTSWPRLSGVALHGGYASAPDNAVKAQLEAELRFGESPSSWALVPSVSFARGDALTALAHSDLSLWGAQLALCPPAFVDQPSVWLRACVNAGAGALHLGIRPRDADLLRFDQDEAWGPWLAVGPSFQAGLPLDEHWSLRGMAQLAVQLLRNRFVVQGRDVTGEALPAFTVYRPETMSLELGLGVGYSF